MFDSRSFRLPLGWSGVLFGAALAAAFWRAPLSLPALLPAPTVAAPSALPAIFTAEMLPPSAARFDAVSLALLPTGQLVAAWSASGAQADDDWAIWFSMQGKEGWGTPQIIASRAATAASTLAHVGQLGNPVLYVEGGWLHLWFASGGGVVHHSWSTDAGKRWSRPIRLPTSPVANLGGRPGGPPRALEEGGLLLPLTHNALGQDEAWLHLSPTGQVVGKQRMAPTVHSQLRLRSGRWLQLEQVPGSGATLALRVSADQGQSWLPARTIESAPDGGAEFSYPSLVLGRDGRVHLAYVWRRQGIKVVSFSEAWLDGAQP